MKFGFEFLIETRFEMRFEMLLRLSNGKQYGFMINKTCFTFWNAHRYRVLLFPWNRYYNVKPYSGGRIERLDK